MVRLRRLFINASIYFCCSNYVVACGGSSPSQAPAEVNSRPRTSTKRDEKDQKKEILNVTFGALLQQATNTHASPALKSDYCILELSETKTDLPLTPGVDSRVLQPAERDLRLDNFVFLTRWGAFEQHDEQKAKVERALVQLLPMPKLPRDVRLQLVIVTGKDTPVPKPLFDPVRTLLLISAETDTSLAAIAHVDRQLENYFPFRTLVALLPADTKLDRLGSETTNGVAHTEKLSGDLAGDLKAAISTCADQDSFGVNMLLADGVRVQVDANTDSNNAGSDETKKNFAIVRAVV